MRKEIGNMSTIGLADYLVVSALLFTLGVCGLVLQRRHVIAVLMSIELMLFTDHLDPNIRCHSQDG